VAISAYNSNAMSEIAVSTSLEIQVDECYRLSCEKAHRRNRMSRRGASLSTTLHNDLSVDEYGMERAVALAEINSAADGLSVCRRFKNSNGSFKVSNSTHRNFSCPVDLSLSPCDFPSMGEMVLHVLYSSYRKS
jgi:hypothetical protein